jgi:hypothetical protein
MRSQPPLFEVVQLLLVFTVYNHCVSAYRPSIQNTQFEFTQDPIKSNDPIVKSLKRPLLTVIDPKTKSRIHLVGVSHGSASSANLVKEVFSEVNPSAVVLELCDDRFWSISLDAKIRPRGNDTLSLEFDKQLEVIKTYEDKKEAAGSRFGIFGFINQLINTLRFASGQGLIGGTFVLLGLFVSNLQRLTRSNTGM